MWYDYTCVAIFKSSMIKMQPNIQKSILHNKLIVCINSGRVLAPVMFTVEGCVLLLDIFFVGLLSHKLIQHNYLYSIFTK